MVTRPNFYQNATKMSPSPENDALSDKNATKSGKKTQK